MTLILALVFFVAMYALIGFISMFLFVDWWGFIFPGNYTLARAAGLLTAVVWPLGWPLMITVGIGAILFILWKAIAETISQVAYSYVILISHFREVLRGRK